MLQSQVDDALKLCTRQGAIVIDVEGVKNVSDEVLVVMETIVPGVGKRFPLDSEPHSDVQQFLITHTGQ